MTLLNRVILVKGFALDIPSLLKCRRGIHRVMFLVSDNTGASDEHLLRTSLE